MQYIGAYNEKIRRNRKPLVTGLSKLPDAFLESAIYAIEAQDFAPRRNEDDKVQLLCQKSRRNEDPKPGKPSGGMLVSIFREHIERPGNERIGFQLHCLNQIFIGYSSRLQQLFWATIGLFQVVIEVLSKVWNSTRTR